MPRILLGFILAMPHVVSCSLFFPFCVSMCETSSVMCKFTQQGFAGGGM